MFFYLIKECFKNKISILDTFKYREYPENFSKKIKKAVKELDSFPKDYEVTGYVIEGLSVYFKPYSTYLIFFAVEDPTITVIRGLTAIRRRVRTKIPPYQCLSLHTLV